MITHDSWFLFTLDMTLTTTLWTKLPQLEPWWPLSMLPSPSSSAQPTFTREPTRSWTTPWSQLSWKLWGSTRRSMEPSQRGLSCTGEYFYSSCCILWGLLSLSRDGVGDGQIPYVLETEVASIESCFKAAGLEDVKFTYIIVSKRIMTRYFYSVLTIRFYFICSSI